MENHVKAIRDPDILAAMEPKAEKPRPRFASTEGMTAQFMLRFPMIDEDGNARDTINIRRPSNREWRSYMRACAAAVRVHGDGAGDDVPMPWVDVSPEFIAEMEVTDAARFDGVMESFFGELQSLLVAREIEEQSTSMQDNG